MPKTRAKSSSTRRRRPRWTPKEAKKVLQAQAESGLTLSAFATDQGLDVYRLYRWRRRLGASAPQPPTFEEVPRIQAAERPPAPAPAQGAPERFEIVLSSGLIIRVAESFNAQALERLLDVVGGRRPC